VLLALRDFSREVSTGACRSTSQWPLTDPSTKIESALPVDVRPAPARGLVRHPGRRVGSVYYIAYASAHGAAGPELDATAGVVLVTIAISVLLHGASAAPLMRLYRSTIDDRRAGAAPSPSDLSTLLILIQVASDDFAPHRRVRHRQQIAPTKRPAGRRHSEPTHQTPRDK